MVEVIPVRLSIEQIRLLAQVTAVAAIDEAKHLRETTSIKVQEQYRHRWERLNELADIFKKISP